MSPLSTDKNSEYISLSEAITLVTYSRDYLGRLAREGKIISKQINKQWFVNRQSLMHFFEHSALEDSIKKRILSISRKNDLEVKDAYSNTVLAIQARAEYHSNVSLLATVVIIAGGLLSGVLLQLSGKAVSTEEVVSFALVKETLSDVFKEADTQTAAVASSLIFTDSKVMETKEKISMEEGIVVFPAGISAGKEKQVTELFSDDVEVVFTSTTTGLVKMVNSDTALPFVRVPEESTP